MKTEKDPFRKKMLDAKQKSYKISMNSSYGAFGVSVDKGMVPCFPVGATTTWFGRQMIQDTKNGIRENFKCEIVYGDSVSKYTVMVVRIDGQIVIDTIENIAKKSRFTLRSDGKETCETPSLETLGPQGWKPVVRIIRHRYKNKLLRVTSNKGYVDVTRDHSMVMADGTVVKPTSLKKGDTLLSAKLTASKSQRYMTDYDEPYRVKVATMLQRDAQQRSISVTILKDTNLSILMASALFDLADNRLIFPVCESTRRYVMRAAQTTHPMVVWGYDEEEKAIIGAQNHGALDGSLYQDSVLLSRTCTKLSHVSSQSTKQEPEAELCEWSEASAACGKIQSGIGYSNTAGQYWLR